MTGTHTLARRDGRSTSFEAAARQTSGKRARLYEIIMARLESMGPLTDEQIARGLVGGEGGFTPSGVRSRRNELVLAGWVTEERDEHGAVVKRRGASGSPCTVWRAVRTDEDHQPPRPTRRAQSGPQGPLLGDESTTEHQEGLRAAMRSAAWHIGSASLGRMIVEAYLDPEGVNRLLDEDDAPAMTDEEMEL